MLPSFPCCRFVDVCDVYGYTPLHYATIERHAEAMGTLLSHDANLIARTAMAHPDYERWV
jgi:ankyrin repeat protein